ncbi:hypothetical protein FQV39_00865 [Bosea sp. F3-2]|uniref:hypothetical protein n=1 Tax=Bosea sp. F3-2 TaxID=2599640 RepID=UPI0011EDF7E6|nr:hypothetical protein [Bosea sp. F3-2]QEL21281.1 hypothetical protein FQV39_00865 [Bosea sp. F3-2]
MRPERVHRIPAPFRISRPGRAPQAANDNVPENRESMASLFVSRSLILAALVAALALMLGWAAWLGRTIWRLFA